MNNGRYLSIMDLGRFDLMLKGKVFWKLIRQGYYPVVSSESIRFKKSLQLFQHFDLITKIESWDERNFYIRQTFVRGDVLIAEGYIKGRFRQRGRKESVSTRELFELVGLAFSEDNMDELANTQRKIEALLCKSFDS